MDDYHQLGLGSYTSIIISVEIRDWGQTLLLSGIYNPGGLSRPFQLEFQGCRQISWEVINKPQHGDQTAEMIGLHLGKPKHQQSAQINTDLFEIMLLYDTWTKT
jgi:hypothetical protein